jgi:hypothetical protein
MFLQLNDRSYIKQKPNSHVFSGFRDNIRSNLEINESAADILSLCDGAHTYEDIVFTLAKKYNDTPENI